MRWIAGVIAAAVLLAVLTYRDRTIERSIEIAAPPRVVWAELMNFSAYPEWNPMVRKIDGVARVGHRLNVRIANQGSDIAFEPRVMAVDPGREFRWIGRVVLPGLLDGEHYFRLEPTSRGTRFIQGERFRGVLVPFVGKAIDVADAFDSANAALRTRAVATIAK